MGITNEQQNFLGPVLHRDRQDFRRANYEALEHWFAALAKRETQPATVLFHGDSIVNGPYADTRAKTFVPLYADSIQRMYRTGGEGWDSVGSYLTGWTFVGGTAITTYGLGLHSRTLVSTTQTATRTFIGDRFWLLFSGDTDTGNAEISIDGGAFTAFATNAGSSTTMKYDSGALAETVNANVHTVTVRGASGATVRLDGIFVFNTDYGRGVQVWGVGHDGYKSTDFTSSSSNHYKALRPEIVRPDLVFIQFGLNDMGVTSEATYKANLKTIIGNYRALFSPDPSFALLGIWAPAAFGFTDADWAPFRRAMREVANEEECVFFDLYDLAGWVGNTGDTQHIDVVLNGTTSITSPTAYFRPADEGKTITGTNIPGGTTVTVADWPSPGPLGATMSQAATGSGTITATIVDRADPDLLTADLLHPSNFGAQWIADELTRLTAGLPRLATIPQGIADAKGDMPVALAADSFGKLPLGDFGEQLTVTPNGTLGVSWLDSGIVSRLMQSLANPGATTFSFTGFAAAPVLTATSGTIANADTTEAPFVSGQTSTTINTDAVLTTAFTICRSTWLPKFATLIRTGSAITTSRIFSGLFSASPLTAADPAISGAGFRYDTVADGTAFWRCWSNDGTSTGTVTVTTKSIAVSTSYRLRIKFRGTLGNCTSIYFYIDDVLVAIHTTNLPATGSNNLGIASGVRCLASLAARALLHSRVGVAY